jgi:hypothetical protein
LSSLPDDVHGRIGDFLESDERGNLRLQSRELSERYSFVATRSYRLRQRFTFVDLQSGLSSNSNQPPSQVISKYRYSSMIGNTKQLKKFNDDAEKFLFHYDEEIGLPSEDYLMDNVLDKDDFKEGFLRKLHTFVLERQAEYPQIIRDWDETVLSLMNKFIAEFPYGFMTLFSPEEIQTAISVRAKNPQNFPFTLIKRKDFSLLDSQFSLPYLRLGAQPPVDISIHSFCEHFLERNVDIKRWERLLIDYMGLPNKESGITDLLKDQFKFRIINAINIELL